MKFEKLILLVCICIFFLASFIPNVLADDLRITLTSYEPKPVMPGNFFTANFKVENTASADLTGVVIELDVSDPFYIEGTDKFTFNLEKDSIKNFSFNVGADGDASSGFETIDIDWDTITNDGSESFSIQVKAIETTLSVESVESIPSEIAPGEESVVKIRIKNNANIILKDIKVKLNLNSADLPFAPIGSVTERNIDTLNAKNSRDLEFKIITLADALSKIYKVPLEISYYDEFGQEFSLDDVIALVVGSKPFLDLNIAKSSLITNQKRTVEIDIVNRGLTNVKFLNAKLLPSEFYEIFNSDTIYVGDVDSDDIETIKFDVKAKQDGYIVLPLQLTYRDANNKLYNEISNVEARVYTIEEAKSAGLINSNYTFFIILTIIIIIVIYFIFRRMLRKKRQNL